VGLCSPRQTTAHRPHRRFGIRVQGEAHFGSLDVRSGIKYLLSTGENGGRKALEIARLTCVTLLSLQVAGLVFGSVARHYRGPGRSRRSQSLLVTLGGS
jgi:hypothetical protein